MPPEVCPVCDDAGVYYEPVITGWSFVTDDVTETEQAFTCPCCATIE